MIKYTNATNDTVNKDCDVSRIFSILSASHDEAYNTAKSIKTFADAEFVKIHCKLQVSVFCFLTKKKFGAVCLSDRVPNITGTISDSLDTFKESFPRNEVAFIH